MFLQTTSASVDPNETPYTGPNVTGFLQDFYNSVKKAFDYKEAQNFFIKLEQDAAHMSKTLSNGVQTNRQAINDALYDTWKDTQDIGGSMKDATDYLTAFQKGTGRVPNITEDSMKSAIELSKATGIATTEIGTYVAKFSEIGIGQDVALKKMTKIYSTARKYGVDAGSLMKTVNENVTRASAYGFKNGVDGLTKMAARSQQLGIDFKLLNGVIEDALDPDKAMVLAANMQMLGGDVGALGDPFQLLHLAQTDVGKLTEEFTKVAAKAVDFNAATGEFKIGTQEMYRLRAMATSLNLSYDQVSEAAVKAAKQTKVLSMITLPSNFSEDDKNLIASLSEINGTKVQISNPETGELIDAQSVTTSMLEKMRESAKDENANMHNIALRQMSAAESAAVTLNRIANSGKIQLGTGGGKSIVKGLEEETKTAKKAQEKVITPGVDAAVPAMMKAILVSQDAITSWIGSASGLQEAITLLTKAIGGSVVTTPVKDMFSPSKNSSPTIMNKGEMFTGIPEDEVLLAPNISEFIQSSSRAFETLQSLNINSNMKLFELMANNSMGPIKPTENLGLNYNNKDDNKINNGDNSYQPQTITRSVTQIIEQNNIEDILSKNIGKINEFQNQTNTTTQKVEGNVGVDGNVNINVNMPNGLLSNALSGDRDFQRSIREEIMNVVNDRLSKAYSRKQGNFKR